MRSRIVRLIAAKELLDTLRDRRTLFVALLLPLLLYPALLLGLTQIIGMTKRDLKEERQRILLDCEGGEEELAKLLSEENLEPIVDAGLAADLREVLRVHREEETDASLGALRSRMERARLQVVLLCAQDFRERMREHRQAGASLLYDPTDYPSQTAREKVRGALDKFTEVQRSELRKRFPDQEQRLRFAEQPVEREVVQVATSSQKGAFSFAPMLGLLIVIMALTGAFYPAVDLAAGEKERGTMETLLVAPVTRTEIVIGKFLAVWVIAVVTALLNLSVMGLTFSKLAGMIPDGSIAFRIPPAAMLAVTTILIPTSALFAAISLALSSFATSYKEGQHYLSPVILIAMPLAMVGLLPNVEITYGLALVPVANVVLLVKAMLLGGAAIGPALVATLATAVYAAIAIAATVSIFRRESVLFRTGSGKGFDAVGLRAKRQGLPTEGLAVALFFVVLALMFFLSGNVESRTDALKAILLAQAAVIVPTLLFAFRWKLNLRETFRLRPLPLHYVPVVVGAAFFTLMLVLKAYSFFPAKEAAGLQRVFELLAQLPAWQLFVLLAILPPVCEEFLCRGFLLSAFRPRRGVLGAIVLSSLLFGLLHLDLFRLPSTFLAGLVLGFICVRTGSLLAAILFHVVFNGLIATGDLIPGLTVGMAMAGPVAILLAVVGLATCLGLLWRWPPPEIDKP